jgi:hypothetical protein
VHFAKPNRRSILHLRTALLVLVSVGAIVGWNMSLVWPQDKSPDLIGFLTGDPKGANYRVDPYIRAAAEIQAMPTSDATDRLLAMARADEGGYRTVLLCRMLFVAKANGTVRRPALGAAVFMGGTDYADWPLEPIEVVDGVPLLITKGYSLAGLPESSERYVRYCLQECEWNPTRYSVKTVAEKRAALAKLIASPKWKRTLNTHEKELLSAQIR